MGCCILGEIQCLVFFPCWGVDPGGVVLGGVDLLGDGDLSAILLTLMLLPLLA
ncbi:hypothetical protein BIFBRE_05107 [Bifidobacterium breve DSM 20213 = JCM 1192]|uniref:Uncharacterized protein n=1 Tax=Bifidobacterium breve DSM 20213 = JCM 1192 TaxID=518634 RepID=D4BSL5_BIFBR|nr:hypothetical protein BIFBRE_05107 [Bifidobacterium breve DSM 20213 = JCM 1192]